MTLFRSIVPVWLKGFKTFYEQKLIDRCCKPFSFEPNELSITSIKDGIPRAPCNMSKADFLSKYVQKRKAVILQGCQKTWRARKWTFEGIFYLVSGIQ